VLKRETTATVKATAPVLAVHGLAIVERFYQRLFEAHPELKNVFNMRHQERGEQQRALAGAVLAYAQNVDNPGALQGAVTRIAHKHCSLGVAAEQYPVVGQNLLAAIADVLGEAATPSIVAAWEEAYGALADIFIDVEGKLYAEVAARPGGWRGWRDFVVAHRRPESEVVTTFYLAPLDRGPIADYSPGQYISIAVDVPAIDLQQIRQYSLSDAPNGRTYRISVKREAETDAETAGYVSNVLHDHVQTGDRVRITPPFGAFTLDTRATTPVVLVSGGVGLTPLIAMLKTVLRDTERQVVFVHGARNSRTHAMKAGVRALAETNRRMHSIVFYDAPLPGDAQGFDYDLAGVVDLARVADRVLQPDADYYLCGPAPFMTGQIATLKSLGVPDGRIHHELFGTGEL
jgi:nitric oxide dioxygenase